MHWSCWTLQSYCYSLLFISVWGVPLLIWTGRLSIQFLSVTWPLGVLRFKEDTLAWRTATLQVSCQQLLCVVLLLEYQMSNLCTLFCNGKASHKKKTAALVILFQIFLKTVFVHNTYNNFTIVSCDYSFHAGRVLSPLSELFLLISSHLLFVWDWSSVQVRACTWGYGKGYLQQCWGHSVVSCPQERDRLLVQPASAFMASCTM